MIVVVTAAIGTTETPPPPPFVDTGAVRYVCASDRADVPGWEIWAAPADIPRRHARDAKMQAVEHFAGDVVVWVDASFDWIASPALLVDVAIALNCNIAAFAHPDRNRISEEGAEVARLGLAPKANVESQIAAYQANGFDAEHAPQTNLTTTGLMVFFPGARVRAFLKFWREQISVHTVRDQLSVDYCAWRSEVRIGYLPGHYRENPFVFYNRARHRARRAA